MTHEDDARTIPLETEEQQAAMPPYEELIALLSGLVREELRWQRLLRRGRRVSKAERQRVEGLQQQEIEQELADEMTAELLGTRAFTEVPVARASGEESGGEAQS